MAVSRGKNEAACPAPDIVSTFFWVTRVTRWFGAHDASEPPALGVVRRGHADVQRQSALAGASLGKRVSAFTDNASRPFFRITASATR
ncbi:MULTISPECIES: hypothetical protein [Amycolatopsis]|uniref:hypothetical protein n=1 Tax=Amycolatopsis TaxID=1813 RepID=UPI0010702C25|nr:MULTISPECIES: hypothetical protein [Amycolatopsis]MCG3752144.1 hypothetical protein [Amycolatopsis sp. Poz14]